MKYPILIFILAPILLAQCSKNSNDDYFPEDVEQTQNNNGINTTCDWNWSDSSLTICGDTLGFVFNQADYLMSYYTTSTNFFTKKGSVAFDVNNDGENDLEFYHEVIYQDSTMSSFDDSSNGRGRFSLNLSPNFRSISSPVTFVIAPSGPGMGPEYVNIDMANTFVAGNRIDSLFASDTTYKERVDLYHFPPTGLVETSTYGSWWDTDQPFYLAFAGCDGFGYILIDVQDFEQPIFKTGMYKFN